MALTRGVSETLRNTLRGHFHPVLLAYADHPSGELRTHTGGGEMSWGGHTWLGASSFVRFRAPEEAGGLVTSEGEVHVAATVEDMMLERQINIRNRSFVCWFGATTEAGGSVLAADPVELFSGYFDSRKGSLVRASANYDHDLIMGLGIGPSARTSASVTHGYEDQITKYPGDTAGRHVQNATKRRFNPQSWPE